MYICDWAPMTWCMFPCIFVWVPETELRLSGFVASAFSY